MNVQKHNNLMSAGTKGHVKQEVPNLVNCRRVKPTNILKHQNIATKVALIAILLVVPKEIASAPSPNPAVKDFAAFEEPVRLSII